MRFLVDNQLPPALARHIAGRGFDCIHVSDAGLATASDREIWAYAEAHTLVLISKDDDFRILANQKRSIPPQVVWVRLGNCRRAELLAIFDSVWPALIDALESGEAIVEIR